MCNMAFCYCLLIWLERMVQNEGLKCAAPRLQVTVNLNGILPVYFLIVCDSAMILTSKYIHLSLLLRKW
jgi:hypothetical protein